MNYKQILRKQEGMTFIEVLIALIIFTAFALSIIPFMTLVLQTSHDNVCRQTATHLAHSRLEEIKTRPYEAVRVGEFTDTETVDGVEYEIITDVTERADGDFDPTEDFEPVKIKTIDVEVKASNVFTGEKTTMSSTSTKMAREMLPGTVTDGRFGISLMGENNEDLQASGLRVRIGGTNYTQRYEYEEGEDNRLYFVVDGEGDETFDFEVKVPSYFEYYCDDDEIWIQGENSYVTIDEDVEINAAQQKRIGECFELRRKYLPSPDVSGIMIDEDEDPVYLHKEIAEGLHIDKDEQKIKVQFLDYPDDKSISLGDGSIEGINGKLRTDNRTLTIDPKIDLNYGTKYTVTLDHNAVVCSENEKITMEEDYQFSFTTAHVVEVNIDPDGGGEVEVESFEDEDWWDIDGDFAFAEDEDGGEVEFSVEPEEGHILSHWSFDGEDYEEKEVEVEFNGKHNLQANFHEVDIEVYDSESSEVHLKVENQYNDFIEDLEIQEKENNKLDDHEDIDVPDEVNVTEFKEYYKVNYQNINNNAGDNITQEVVYEVQEADTSITVEIEVDSDGDIVGVSEVE